MENYCNNNYPVQYYLENTVNYCSYYYLLSCPGIDVIK